MNQLQKIFNYGEVEVRTIVKDGEPWFVAKDVCEVLDLANTTKAIGRLDEDEKGLTSIQTLGGTQEVNIVNEPGLYSLILGSKKSEAKQFKRWVTHEVLPSIRKHGAYMTDDVLEEAIANPDFMIGLLTNLKEEKQKRQLAETKNLMLEQQLAESEPKITYYDKILASNGTMTVTQIAKDYGLTAYKLNQILHAEGIQYKQSKQWFLYSAYADKGYTKSTTHIDETGEPRMNTRWTQKGRLFVHGLLGELGIHPVEDQQLKEAN